MTEQDMEWEIHKLLTQHRERRLGTERRIEVAMFILIILGMLVYQSEDRAFKMPYIGVEIPRTFLVVTMPVIISAVYNILISVMTVNLVLGVTIDRNLFRFARSQKIELSDYQMALLRTLRLPSFYMPPFVTKSMHGARWANLVPAGFHILSFLLLPLVAIGYFLSQSWSQTNLWIWVTTVLMSLLLVITSFITIGKTDLRWYS